MVKDLCQDCGKVYLAGPNSFLCPECRKKRQRELAKKRNLSKLGRDARSKQKGDREGAQCYLKAVLISIKPKWCKLIMGGQKTVEIRKSRPKSETPFKCYIYCTENKDTHDLLELHTNDGKIKKMNGKVIGEFVCDRISEYEMEWRGGYAKDTYQDIRVIYYDGDLEREEPALVASNEMTEGELNNCYLLDNSRLSFDDIGKYVCGKKDFGFHTFYGWHISNLIIYDTPKELPELKGYDSECLFYAMREYGCKDIDGKRCRACHLFSPPQSWRYVEELKEKQTHKPEIDLEVKKR